MIGYDVNMKRYVKNKIWEVFPRSVYYFFVIHFWTFEAKVMSQKCILFFCDSFWDFWVKMPFPRSVYYFLVIHFWTFEPKAMFPEVYTILW